MFEIRLFECAILTQVDVIGFRRSEYQNERIRHIVARFRIASHVVILHHRKNDINYKIPRQLRRVISFERDRIPRQKIWRHRASLPMRALIRATLCQSKIDTSNRNARVRDALVAY